MYSVQCRSKAYLCLQEELEKEVGADESVISTLKADVARLTHSSQETSDELQALKAEMEGLEEAHASEMARVEGQLEALEKDKVSKESPLPHCSVIFCASCIEAGAQNAWCGLSFKYVTSSVWGSVASAMLPAITAIVERQLG